MSFRAVIITRGDETVAVTITGLNIDRPERRDALFDILGIGEVFLTTLDAVHRAVAAGYGARIETMTVEEYEQACFEPSEGWPAYWEECAEIYKSLKR